MATTSRSKSSRGGKSAGGRASSKRGTSTKSGAKRQGSGKRERISPNSDTRYVRRSGSGRFKESDDMGRSLARDRKTAAKTKTKSGYGDRGDR